MSGEQKTKLLFVDDEPSIRVTIPLILERNGFDVTAVDSVKDAIQAISSHPFDVLLTDLNIGQPGDGFTVVSAMRRTQPNVATVILTGYPAFETALAAIRSQVDEYLVKPAHPDELVRTLREKLAHRRKDHSIITMRLPEMIQQHREELIQGWLELVDDDEDLRAIKMTRAERVDHLPLLLDEVVRIARDGGEPLSARMKDAAEKHGLERRRCDYTVPLLLRENRLLRRTLANFIQNNLIGIEISYVIPDMTKVDEAMGSALELSLTSFLRADASRPPKKKRVTQLDE